MKFTTSLTALAACAGLALTAGAQTVSTSASDLILGFRASGGTGAASNLVVDLGAFTDYTSGGSFADGSAHLIGNLSATDLSSTFGATWNTRSDVTWGVAGATGNSLAGFTVYATKAESTVGLQSDAYDAMSKATLNTIAGPINGAVADLNGASATVNSSFSSVQASSDPTSWTSHEFIQPGISFNGLDTDSAFENNTATLSGWVVSDLYKLTANSVSYVGSFGLSSQGKLYYSNSAASFSAVPEPSTYAAIAGVLALGFVVYRRRQQAKILAA